MKIRRIKLNIKAGNGGAGSCSFFSNKSGPCGGNGGNGGSIYVRANANYCSLSHYAGIGILKAENGKSGGRKNFTGAHGKNLYIEVPLGTRIQTDVIDHIIVSLDECILLQSGTSGGLGNYAFKNSIEKTPRIRTCGDPTPVIRLIMTVLPYGDIALIGFPNSGKSTIMQKITKSKSPIGHYPFTTRKPYVGYMNDIRVIDLPPIGSKYPDDLCLIKSIIIVLNLSHDGMYSKLTQIFHFLKKYNYSGDHRILFTNYDHNNTFKVLINHSYGFVIGHINTRKITSEKLINLFNIN